MSVLRSKRGTAYTEFERNMIKLHKFTMERTSNLAKRKRKYTLDPIFKLTNRAYTDVCVANEKYTKDERQLIERNELIFDAINSLLSLQKPLWVYWNVAESSDETMMEWCSIINTEIVLLGGLMKYDKKLPYVIPLYKQYNKAVFVKNMRNLHKYTHQKISRAPYQYEYLCKLIAGLVDDALAEVVSANEHIPENKEQYETRTSNLKHAIQHINAMQRPILSLLEISNYNDGEISTWATLIEEELKLISGLLKSDKERYSNLE